MLKISLFRIKILCVLTTTVMLIVCICGCSDGSYDASDKRITFTDALGRSVSVAENPGRVAALIGSFAEVWQLSGGKLCAAAEDAWDDFDLELDSCVNIGGAHSPALEALLSANPDFVLASASTSADVKMKDSLENAGITVAYFDVDGFDDYLHMLDVCTDITGRKDLYEKNGVNVKNQIDEIRKIHRDADIEPQKRTVLLLRASSGSVKAKGSEGTVLGEMLCDLGCVNIADSDTKLLENLSVESIIRQNPYRIFAVAMGDDKKAEENLMRIMNENPAWATLDAVKQRRVYVMERKLFNLKPNEDWAKAYEKLSKILLDKAK